MLLALGVVMSGASRVAYAGFADGTGGGQYQNQIYWLDWAGFSFTNGNSKTFTLPGGVTVTATVSNISGGAVSIGRPEDYGPAAMNRAYPNTGQTAIKSCDQCTNTFRLTFSASLGGTSIPVDLVAIDAEAAASNEYLKVTTDGNAWQLLEQFEAVNLSATWSNSDRTLELQGNGATTYGTALAVSTNVTNFDFEIKGGGISAAALGVFLPFDYGDAPASFGDASHYIRQAFTGGLPGATKVYDPVSTAFTSFATVSDAPTVFTGAVKPDADPGTQNTGANAATALGDDTNNTDDEDGVASFPPLTILTGSYSIQVAVTNTSGSAATLYGWIDFNGNGSFEPAEVQTASVLGDGSVTSVTLTWPTVSVASGATIYARLRFTTSSLSSAQGPASDGEVEDYLIPVTPLGSLTVVKNAVGGDDSFTFGSQTLTPTPFTLSTTSGTAQRTFANLLPGTYDVTETVPAGWDLTSAICSDGSNPASINLALSENVTCTFTNTKLGSLTVVKNTTGGDGSFAFTSTIPSATTFTLATAGNTAQRAFPNLAPGTYSVSETVPAGWDLTSATCSDGSNPASINLAAGENVTCTFANRQRGSLTVVKNTTGGDGSFAFTSTIPSATSFTLATAGNTAQRAFPNLAPGTYSVSETVPAGWDLTSATCSDGSNPASINLAAGENVTCTFANRQRGSLTVVKNTTGGDGSFAFTSTIPSATTFTLATVGNTAQRAFPNLAPGTYSVSETVPAGWDLTSATCSDGSNPASIDLAAGENVTCTFANARQGTIIVVKRALGEDRAFSFVSASLGNFDLTTVNGEVQRTFSNLSPGTHDVSETVPSGWELSGGDPTCSDGSPASSINLGAGETVLCVFINLQDDTVVIEARTTGGDGSFPFTSGTLTPPSFTLTTAGGTTQRSFANLPPGTYDVNATVPAGWNLSSATCDNGDPPDRISMAPDQTVRCTFVYQITIAADIPTLSEWGLLLLGALLAFNLWWRGPGRLAGRR
ncbi:MAG: IPTL-CTERM sorting domain-containing protein [Candidatus Contendobacter sp.]|nr:MAG: IPTL-CTERM sorting domain-containing protein [Candidatus Contendobacter sp.]